MMSGGEYVVDIQVTGSGAGLTIRSPSVVGPSPSSDALFHDHFLAPEIKRRFFVFQHLSSILLLIVLIEPRRPVKDKSRIPEQFFVGYPREEGDKS
jgi:hypothetical protein